MKKKIYKPFGPSIGVFEIEDKIINNINTYVEKLITSEEKVSKLDMGSKLAGQVRQEFSLENNYIAKEISPFLVPIIKTYVFDSVGKNVTKINFSECWVVRQYKHEYNPLHSHSTHISGVLYLKVPLVVGESKKKNNQHGQILFTHGGLNFFSPSNIRFLPTVGLLLMFPSYLQHTVYPFFDSEEERRSMAFNIRVNEDIVK